MLLASKFYEPDENLIMTSDIQAKFKRAGLSYLEMKRAEVHVLNKLGWDLLRITVLDFVQAYSALGIVHTSDRVKGDEFSKVQDKHQLLINLEKTVNYLTEWTLEHFKTKFKCSDLAAAIIGVARKIHGI